MRSTRGCCRISAAPSSPISTAPARARPTFALDLGDGAPVKPADAAANLAFGAELRSYRFDKYRTKQKPEQKPSLAGITVASEAAGAAKEAYRALGATAEAVFFTRDLVSEPANTLYPETLAQEAASLTEFGLSVEILDEDRMRELGMGALLGVGQGSVRPSRVVVMEHRGGPPAARRSASSARGSPSTPAASRSSRPPAWAR